MFAAINVKSLCTFTDTRFYKVPNFVQANFAQAPGLDTIDIEPHLKPWQNIKNLVTSIASIAVLGSIYGRLLKT